MQGLSCSSSHNLVHYQFLPFPLTPKNSSLTNDLNGSHGLQLDQLQSVNSFSACYQTIVNDSLAYACHPQYEVTDLLAYFTRGIQQAFCHLEDQPFHLVTQPHHINHDFTMPFPQSLKVNKFQSSDFTLFKSQHSRKQAQNNTTFSQHFLRSIQFSTTQIASNKEHARVTA